MRELTKIRYMVISIHALLAESDPPVVCCCVAITVFLSTLSLRRATHHLGAARGASHAISIHALLAESDCNSLNDHIGDLKFLSTLSLRRATAKVHKTVGHFCAEETHFMESAFPSWQ